MKRYFAAARTWLGTVDAALFLSASAILVGLWVFVAFAYNVGTGGSQEFDERVVRGLRDPDDPAKPLGPRWAADVGRDLTALGGGAALTILISAVTGYLLLARKSAAAAFLLVATVGGSLVCTLLKDVFDRPRPSVVPHLSYVSNASFPSGHSMQAAVVYLTLGSLLSRLVKQRRLKVYFVAVALTLTLLVGLSRVYMGVHYPTDVLAGWSLGLAWAVGCDYAARRLQKRGAVEQTAVPVGEK